MKICLADLKKGEVFKRKENAKTIFIKGHYDRGSKTYSASDTLDMNREIFLKGSTVVFTGFDY